MMCSHSYRQGDKSRQSYLELGHQDQVSCRLFLLTAGVKHSSWWWWRLVVEDYRSFIYTLLTLDIRAQDIGHSSDTELSSGCVPLPSPWLKTSLYLLAHSVSPRHPSRHSLSKAIYHVSLVPWCSALIGNSSYRCCNQSSLSVSLSLSTTSAFSCLQSLLSAHTMSGRNELKTRLDFKILYLFTEHKIYRKYPPLLKFTGSFMSEIMQKVIQSKSVRKKQNVGSQKDREGSKGKNLRWKRDVNTWRGLVLYKQSQHDSKSGTTSSACLAVSTTTCWYRQPEHDATLITRSAFVHEHFWVHFSHLFPAMSDSLQQMTENDKTPI